MDSFELNKIIAAVLLVALLIIGIGKFTNMLFYTTKPEQSAYKIEGLETIKTTSNQSTADEKKAEVVDIKQLLALGDLVHGEKVFKKCSACHMIVSGGKI